MKTKEMLRSCEARIFSKYLIGIRVNDAVCLKYDIAINFHALQCEGKDKKLESFVLKFPFWIGFVDAALALTCKNSILRKKLFVMLAILETIPEYSVFFLPKRYSVLSFFKIFLTGIRSIYRFFIGIIIVGLF